MTFIEQTAVLGSLGEFIGSFAVLVTLIYLSVQVRHARRESSSNALQQRNNQVLAVYGNITTSATLAEAVSIAESHYSYGDDLGEKFRQGLITDVGLSEKQAYQVAIYQGLIWSTYVTQYVAADESAQNVNDFSILRQLQTGLGAQYWDSFRLAAPANFVEHVDELRSVGNIPDVGR